VPFGLRRKKKEEESALITITLANLCGGRAESETYDVNTLHDKRVLLSNNANHNALLSFVCTIHHLNLNFKIDVGKGSV
jgi:hypothetical protein